MDTKPEILINATQVTHQDYGDSYEFILNDKLCVVECVKVVSVAHGLIRAIENPQQALEQCLFELNHVRVNPRIDNTYVISCLTNALEEIGVDVSNPPNHDEMQVCFKPLGEISHNVRFYLGTNAKMVFLSPSTKPKLINAVQTPKSAS